MIKLFHAPLINPLGVGDDIRKHQNFSLQYDSSFHVLFSYQKRELTLFLRSADSGYKPCAIFSTPTAEAD